MQRRGRKKAVPHGEDEAITCRHSIGTHTAAQTQWHRSSISKDRSTEKQQSRRLTMPQKMLLKDCQQQNQRCVFVHRPQGTDICREGAKPLCTCSCSKIILIKQQL